MPAGTTSFPMPSPAMTAMRCVFIVSPRTLKRPLYDMCRGALRRKSYAENATADAMIPLSAGSTQG